MLRRYADPNEGLRLNGPDTHFANTIWSVVLTNNDPKYMIACPFTLVTNDGEYLVLFGRAFDFRNALSIYRRRDHPGQPFGGPGPDHGVLIRQIPLSDFWAPEHFPVMITDHTPAWFASGTFEFSSNNRILFHKTRWGGSFQICLADGKVTSR